MNQVVGIDTQKPRKGKCQADGTQEKLPDASLEELGSIHLHLSTGIWRTILRDRLSQKSFKAIQKLQKRKKGK